MTNFKFVYGGKIITWLEGEGFSVDDSHFKNLIDLAGRGFLRAQPLREASAPMADLKSDPLTPQGALTTVFHAFGNRATLIEAPQDLRDWYIENSRAESPLLCGTPRVNAEIVLRERKNQESSKASD